MAIEEKPSTESVGDPAALTYAAVFRHSNDALYLLDSESQRFLEVNPAFVQLTGYSREEMLSGSIPAPSLVAPESAETFNLIRATQTSDSSDRFELKILCKNGEKRPVEFSVNRIRLDGRDVDVGSMRDLTLRKRLEQNMREKIGEVAVANSRDIRRVRLVPADAGAPPAAVAAIAGADQVVLAPGSLYTSILPVLCVPALRRALAVTPAMVVQVANLRPQLPEAGDKAPRLRRDAGGGGCYTLSAVPFQLVRAEFDPVVGEEYGSLDAGVPRNSARARFSSADRP